MPYTPIEYVVDNNLYGLAYWLKKYTNFEGKIDGFIEYGLFLGNYVKKESILSFTNSIITFGNRRKEHLIHGGVKKKIHTIGPYIHYAQPILIDDKFIALKKELGKVLLVFPSHSIKNLESNYAIDKFVNEIEAIKKDFDNVLICMYFIYIQNLKLTQMYKNKGYKIVTAGHLYDFNFLARLKSIIMLSDYTLSNSPGTHVGYCIFLKKAHYIFNQDITQSGNNLKEINLRDEIETKSLIKEQKELIDCFASYNPNTIADEQIKLVNELWGVAQLKKIKSSKEY